MKTTENQSSFQNQLRDYGQAVSMWNNPELGYPGGSRFGYKYPKSNFSLPGRNPEEKGLSPIIKLMVYVPSAFFIFSQFAPSGLKGFVASLWSFLSTQSFLA